MCRKEWFATGIKPKTKVRLNDTTSASASVSGWCSSFMKLDTVSSIGILTNSSLHTEVRRKIVVERERESEEKRTEDRNKTTWGNAGENMRK